MYGDYRPSYHTIEPHDGMIYVVSHDYASDEPEEFLHWYATGVQTSGLWAAAGGYMPGIVVKRNPRNGLYAAENNHRISIRATETRASRTTRQHVPCPKHREIKYPLVYKNGYWYQDCKSGWERL